MTHYEPTLQTIILVAVFSLWYMILLVRRTVSGRLDFYDLAMLSTVALLPALFVSWPELAELLGTLAGVAFPFIVMFGTLILMIFVFLHRTTIKMHEVERLNRFLIQEVSLLKHELERGQAKRQEVH